MTPVVKILERRLATLAGFAVGAAIMALLAPPAVLEFDRSELPIGSAEVATPTRADRLVEKHDCWSSDAPPDMAGEVPGHVVVSLDSGRTVYSSSLVGKALDQTFVGPDADLLVHAFCR